MAVHETIINGAIVAGGALLVGVFAAIKTLQGTKITNKVAADKNLDDAQQKLLESTLKELHDTQIEARATRQELEANLKEERARNAALQERLNLAFESNIALKQRLTEIETTKDVIGAVSVEPPKQIGKYEG